MLVNPSSYFANPYFFLNFVSVYALTLFLEHILICQKQIKYENHASKKHPKYLLT